MIPKPTIARQAPVWQHRLREAYTRPHELLAALELDPGLPMLDAERLRDFPLRVPRGYAELMRKGDSQDPLFLQVWPQRREADAVPGYGVDAVGDLHKLKGGGLIHKYRGRVLVIATGACAVHCRYCFRRHFPYGEQLAAREHWREALETLRSDASIEEVILSGGDPLSLADDKLAEFADALEHIPHLKRLRLHTRQPVVLPERLDAAFLDWFMRGRLQKILVLHVNHGNEVGPALVAALKPLRSAGVMLLNQSVLLRGVNDSAKALVNLSERLLDAGVMPYYLHLLDRVLGAAHFELGEDEAALLMRDLAAHLPGYAVPRLVREIAGAPAKTLMPW